MASNTFPERPPIPSITVGRVYLYQGRCKRFHGKKVKVIAPSWDGSSLPEDAHLVHVCLLNRAENPTEDTFGCDPRWLSDGAGLSPYLRYHNELAKGNSKLKQHQEKAVGIPDPEDESLWELTLDVEGDGED